MALTNEQLADIFREYHTEQMQAINAIEKHQAQMNGFVQRNTADISKLPCAQHSDAIVALKTTVGLSPTPRDAGRAEATQEAHAVNWTRVWALVAIVLVLILTAVVGSVLL